MTVDFFDSLRKFLSQDPEDEPRDLSTFVQILDTEGRERFSREIAAVTDSLQPS